MLDRDELNKLMRAVLETSDHELGCDECLDQVDRFVEMELAGLDAAAAMPLVHNHLQKCGDCREEFEALLVTVQAMEGRNGDSILDSMRRLWRGRRGGS
ncbi:MAG: hypothetical protein M3N10_07305 [Actinomycetota bacterium]|nr:hypothetical protein [Actinomycetota bacterium]HZY64405.1 hypothetical protein [Rubrobacteraceae bacterium]